ncbi:hypothetical protein PtB15_8B125 [Puccinia triticina]|nr:hypothetical protein PtB15_8B125 [Puccinia triticina]
MYVKDQTTKITPKPIELVGISYGEMKPTLGFSKPKPAGFFSRIGQKNTNVLEDPLALRLKTTLAKKNEKIRVLNMLLKTAEEQHSKEIATLQSTIKQMTAEDKLKYQHISEHYERSTQEIKDDFKRIESALLKSKNQETKLTKRVEAQNKLLSQAEVKIVTLEGFLEETKKQQKKVRVENNAIVKEREIEQLCFQLKVCSNKNQKTAAEFWMPNGNTCWGTKNGSAQCQFRKF